MMTVSTSTGTPTKIILGQRFLSIPPENIAKSEVFLMLSWSIEREF